MEDNLTGKKREEPDYMKMPQKGKYRMRAHCNPLGEVPFPYPETPSCVDWTKHYQEVAGKPKDQWGELHANSWFLSSSQISRSLREFSQTRSHRQN